ncbi:transposase [Prevotella intermedia]|uniref:Transposase n=1 Tax=Prevotella intermedia TaxID=28131 RepID=A0A2D3N9B6_PREIN|nr:transposase [Prevotella intermedia]ATV52020.1 transposase [Prevotella intermedia]
MGKQVPSLEKVQGRTQQCIFHIYGLPSQVQRCIYTTNWIERLNRKYKRTINMRTSMPSEKSVIFLLAAVAMEQTKTTYSRKTYQFKSWKEKNKKGVEEQRKER